MEARFTLFNINVPGNLYSFNLFNNKLSEYVVRYKALNASTITNTERM